MNSFGRLFRLSVFGESHGESVGLLLDGVRPEGQKALVEHQEKKQIRQLLRVGFLMVKLLELHY